MEKQEPIKTDSHPHINGYRNLNREEIDLINEIKALESNAVDLVERIQDRQAAITAEFGTGDAEPLRWSSTGKTDIQKGCMALVRAVAKPEPV